MKTVISLQRSTNRLSVAAPLYTQIAESLLDQIESGKLVPGQRLAPERELSQTLGVNRVTLRQALQLLEAQGLLIRRQGHGTYIAEPKIERQAGKLFSFTRGMERRGYKPGAQVIVFNERPVEASIAVHLKLPVSAPVYEVHRLRTVNEEPVLLEQFTIPVHRFPNLDKHDLANRSMFEVMEKEYGVVVSQARQSLEPVVATEYEAGLFGITMGAPLMLERRLSFDKDSLPVEYGKDLYRGDRFRFVTDIASLEL
ncbi:MAG: GntR family transcriptional regulator [Chloroflexi bacterium]|nr:GntR family transcriptional regulator [Chloroflexota bacterium]